MKKLIALMVVFTLALTAFAQEQDKGSAQPATKAIPPTEQGEKATPATPSPNAAHGMEQKAKNMEKRDAKKAAKKLKKDAKKEAKEAKKAAKSEHRGH